MFVIFVPKHMCTHWNCLTEAIPMSTHKIWFGTIKTLNYNTQQLSCHGQITLTNIDEICSLAIPNQISLISMHVPNLVKIPWHLHKLSTRNENMGVSRADNSVKIWRNLPTSSPKPDLHNINAHTKFGENHSSYHPETKYRQTDGWLTDRHLTICK